MLREASELTARGEAFLQSLYESAADTTACFGWKDAEDYCYWNHRPYVPNELSYGGKDFRPSFEASASLKEVYPPSLRRDSDIEYAYWWDIENGVLVAEAGPLGSQDGVVIATEIDLSAPHTLEAITEAGVRGTRSRPRHQSGCQPHPAGGWIANGHLASRG